MIFNGNPRYKQLFAILGDALLISASIYLSYCLRFGTIIPYEYLSQIYQSVFIIVVLRIIIFISMGLYSGMWRFVGMRDLLSIIMAVTVSSGVAVLLLFLFFRLETYPRSIFIIDWFVLIVLLGGTRFSYRFYHERRKNKSALGADPVKNVLIVGAGSAGEMILREILNNYHLRYKPVGFADDNRKKKHMTIHGFHVLGNTRDIQKIVKTHKVDEIIIAIPTASLKSKRRILHICKKTQVTCKTLPSVSELIKGTVKVSSLREFQIEDLLGRETAKLDTAAIKEYLRDKTVMITGAGGSIGSELCKQVLRYFPKRLVLIERSEYNLYQIEMKLTELYPDAEIHPVIGDVLNQDNIQRIMEKFKPEVVYHAAAYKHVPLMELNPHEAIRNNVFGTWTIAYFSKFYGVKKFVMVSTDKAVRPTNIMGASKRIAELICQGFGSIGPTKFVTVRFGNVLNSVGSVIPLFKQQIAAGGPITVTHPEIYRYFMTIPESVQLIMQAGAMGKGGELFLLDMGEPVKILDLANDMIRLSGLEPDRDIKIVFTGLRPGEKMYEELLTEGEEVKSTLHEKIKVANAERIDWNSVIKDIDNLLETLKNGSTEEIFSRVKKIVPEFQPEKGGPKGILLRNMAEDPPQRCQDYQNT